MKLTKTGDVVWQKSISSSTHVICNSLTLDSSNNLYVAAAVDADYSIIKLRVHSQSLNHEKKSGP